MPAIETGTDIAAPPWRVWRLLTDFDAYPAWNPFLTRVQGRPEPGARLRVRVEAPGRSALVLTPRVAVLETGRALHWRGRLLFLPGLLDAEHAFHLKWLADARDPAAARGALLGAARAARRASGRAGGGPARFGGDGRGAEGAGRAGARGTGNARGRLTRAARSRLRTATATMAGQGRAGPRRAARPAHTAESGGGASAARAPTSRLVFGRGRRRAPPGAASATGRASACPAWASPPRGRCPSDPWPWLSSRDARPGAPIPCRATGATGRRRWSARASAGGEHDTPLARRGAIRSGAHGRDIGKSPACGADPDEAATMVARNQP